MIDASVDAVDRRETPRVGRRARLELVFGVRRNLTVLRHAYAEAPFRANPPFRAGRGLRMILAWSAPGIFGGDDLEQTIRVEPGASVDLISQSSTQVHPAHGAPTAALRSTYDVAADATLTGEWDPVIPFAGSRLTQTIDLRVDAGASLFWSDGFMSGRGGSGERWAFKVLEHQLALWRSGRLSYLERYRLAPANDVVTAPWMAASAGYFGTVLVAGRAVTPAVGGLQQALGRVDGLRAAADVLEPDLAIVRLMADRGAGFHQARRDIRRSLWP